MTDSLAQKLDSVKLSIYGYDRSGPITVEWTSFDELRDKIAAMESENAELKQAIQNKLEWISIKDRLPTEAGDYAIINTYRGKSVRFAAHWFGNRWGEFLAGDITHWAEFLPLPVYPPKT